MQSDQEIIDEWFRDNQLRITIAVVTGIAEVDTVAQMLVDPTVTSAEQWHQFFDGLDTAGRGVLAEHIAAAFGRVFRHSSEGLRDALVQQSESIVREQLDEYIGHLMAFAVTIRTVGNA